MKQRKIGCAFRRVLPVFALAVIALSHSGAARAPVSGSHAAHVALPASEVIAHAATGISASLPAMSSQFSDHVEMDSPIRPAPSVRAGRAGVLPVVKLQVDQAARKALRDRVRESDGGIILRNFVLAPDAPGGPSRTVDLDLYEIEVFSEFTQFVDASRPGGLAIGGLGEVLPTPDITLLGGRVVGQPDSSVFLSMSAHGTHGYVRTGARTQVLSSGPEGEGRDVLIYDMEALPEGTIPWRDFVCEVHAAHADVKQPAVDFGGIAGVVGEGGVAGAANCRRAVIAVETDHEYTAVVFGGNTAAAAAYAATTIAAASEIYQSHLNVALQIGTVRLWSKPNDPWTENTTNAQLVQFRDVWNATMSHIPRHLAHFLSGRSLGGGIAYLGVLCSGTHGYGLSSGLNGFFPYPLQNNSPQNWDIFVVAHELGHNFSAIHTHDYCPPLDSCASGDAMTKCQSGTVCQVGTIMSYCHTCGGGMSNIMLEFHPQVQADMLAYVNSIPTSVCSLECDPWIGHDGDFCLPATPIPCETEDPTLADWLDWRRLIRNGGLGAFREEDFDNYGLSVAVDGDVALVAAPRHDHINADETVFSEFGAVYVFRFLGGEWVEVQKLEPPSACSGTLGRFGETLAVASSPAQDIAVVGVPLAQVDGIANRGAVWVFRRTGIPGVNEVWEPEGMIVDEIDPKDPKAGGGPAGDDPDPCDLVPRLTAADGFGGDVFGSSVAIMPFRLGADTCGGGDVIVVGARDAIPFLDCETGGLLSGAAYIFRHDEIRGGWRQEAKLVTCGLLDGLGSSVAAGYSAQLNEEIVVAGAWASSVVIPPDEPKDPKDPKDPPQPTFVEFTGQSFVYRSGTSVDEEGNVQVVWNLNALLHADHPRTGDLFGFAMDFDSSHDGGDVIIIGAPLRDFVDDPVMGESHSDFVTDEGGAFIFRRTSGGWVQEAELYGFEPEEQSVFGGAVGISRNMAVVGAFGKSGPDPDRIGGTINNVGAAYVFRDIGGDWMEDAELVPWGEWAGLGSDEFGISVGISRNAIVVGARNEIENDVTAAGTAYMFGHCPPPCPGSGSCFAANPTPGCASGGGACCELVCEKMPFCCDGFWGPDCVAEAMTVCAGCGDPISGSCHIANETTGCANAACCADVCAIDDHCCEFEWDQTCVNLAASIGSCLNPTCPGAGDCTEAQVTPGCSDAACCEAVCSLEPFCCGALWDADCAALAVTVCAPPKPDCPGDGNGDGVVNIFDLLDLLSQWGACADCADCPLDLSGLSGEPDCTINIFDLLALLANWGSCE